MDNCRFDNWTRMVAGKSDRRTAVMGLAGGAAALLTLIRAELGIAQESDVVALEAACRDNGARCRRDNNCCSLNCKRGRRGGGRRRGRCKCAEEGNSCRADSGCCSGVCRGGNCECGLQGDFCNGDNDCCSNRCSGQKCQCIKQGDRCDADNECCGNNTCNGGFCR
jgi:hypothetical protein